MTVRYYFSDVTGDGLTAPTAFRPAVSDLLGHDACKRIDGRVNGTVASGRMLVWGEVSDPEHATLIADARVIWLPFATAGGAPVGEAGTVGDVSSANRTLMTTRLEAGHVPADGFVLADSLGLVLKRIKRRILARQVLKADDWSEGLDTLVSAMNAAKRTRIAQALTDRGFDMSDIQGSDTIRAAIKKLVAQAPSVFTGT